MRSLLGVPIAYHQRSVGNLYLTNKQGAEEFAEADQQAVELLAQHAALAVEHAHAHERLLAERQRLDTVLSQSPSPILFYDGPDGETGMANQAAVRLLGIQARRKGEPDEMLRIVSGEGEPPFRRALMGESVEAEEFDVQAVGGPVSVLVNAVPVIGTEGDTMGALVTLQDISALKALTRLREEWIAVITHDLRQPVANILLRSDLLLTRSLDVKAKSDVENIGISARHLQRMIFDLLDISRLEAQELTLEKQPVALSDLVEQVVHRIPELHNRDVVIERDEGLPSVYADPLRLEQVLVNLLTNSVKYGYRDTPIVVHLQQVNGQLRVSVTNEGEGISGVDLKNLFKRFHRAPYAQKEKIAGLGLGLYIAKGLVEAHEGKMWAESTPRGKTSFSFVLPVGDQVDTR